jgi:hypothetical protein
MLGYDALGQRPLTYQDIFFIVVNTVDMSVGFASIILRYVTTVMSGSFSNNKQWNPVQKGIVWVMISLWMGS